MPVVGKGGRRALLALTALLLKGAVLLKQLWFAVCNRKVVYVTGTMGAEMQAAGCGGGG